MTAIVTGTDGRLYVHQMGGEARVFVTEALDAGAAAPAGHARLVAWLDPVDPDGERRARVRLPGGPIVEVAADAVCNADNIARARIAPAMRQANSAPVTRPEARPGARPQTGPQTRPWQCLYFLPEPQGQAALRGVAAQVEGSAGSTSAETSGARAPCTAVP